MARIIVMRDHVLFRSALPFVLVALAGGCGSDRDEAPDARIEAAFPAPARHLLAKAKDPSALEERAQGFAIRGPRPIQARAAEIAPEGIEAILPRQGSHAIRIRLPGFEAQITEDGLEGEGRIRGGAVVYARARGASLWRQSPAGCEEWLLFEGGTGSGEEPLATWHVEGARLALHGDEVRIFDDRGEEKIEVRAPLAFTEQGATLPIRLEVQGQDIALFAAPTAETVLIDPEWVPAGSMNNSRYGHDAVRLQDGRVLVAGQSSSAEVYDESTDTWTPTGILSTGHSFAQPTLLDDGRVLMTGGLNGGSAVAATEIYDPSTNQWTTTGSMSTVRWYHTSTLLPNGKVLVAGGQTGTAAVYLTSAELYDPTMGTWTPTGSMAAGRSQHFAALLPNGKVIVGGGSSSAMQAELYDPATGTWSPAAPLMTSHTVLPRPVLLPSGKLLVTGGNVVSGDVSLYDPMADSWSLGGTLLQPRIHSMATLLPNGGALVTGGFISSTYLDEAEVYDPTTNSWSVTTPMLHPRNRHSATLLSSGGVLVAGGFDGSSFLTTAEIYQLGAAQGASCQMNSDCTSGNCAQGVCCNSACNGACEACTVAGGASQDGVCTPLSGVACDDGDPCTTGDMCQAGSCAAGSPLVCNAMDECHDVGVCDPQNGMCSNPAKTDGSPCTNGICQGGQCNPTSASGGGGGQSGTGGANAGGGGGQGTGGGNTTDDGGCGCAVVGASESGGAWLGLALFFAATRRRRREQV